MIYSCTRFYVLTLLLLGSFPGMSQEKDTRALLYRGYGIRELAIAPDSSIWLCSTDGQLAYATHGSRDWHYGQRLFKTKETFEIGQDRPEHISFFDQKHAIITGYMSYGGNTSKKGGLYHTQNGGKSWKKLDFEEHSWIYDVFTTASGKAWMGGSSSDIYYSADYGVRWEKLNSPFIPYCRVNCIDMKNDQEGIAGALMNALFVTSDNWKTAAKIPTPLDQEAYINHEDLADGRIHKACFWKDYVVINQENRIFYSLKDKIQWKQFPIDLLDFELNSDQKSLFAIDRDKKVLVFSDIGSFAYLPGARLRAYPSDMKVFQGTAYILDQHGNLLIASRQSSSIDLLYTREESIPRPRMVAHHGNIDWGLDYKHLYLSEDQGQHWYREAVAPMNFEMMTPLADSTFLFWDGQEQNFTYTIGQQQFVPYKVNEPIQEFLNYPIKKMWLRGASSGCFHFYEDTLAFIADGTGQLRANDWYQQNYKYQKTTVPFNSEIAASKLHNILSAVNAQPYKRPSVKDFGINAADIQSFLAFADSLEDKDQAAVYRKIPQVLDTLSDAFLLAVIRGQERFFSTTTNRFSIHLVNENGDSLSLERCHFFREQSWIHPLNMCYKGLNIPVYDPALSNTLLALLPEDFTFRDLFDRRNLLMLLADYLYNQSSK